MILESVVIFDEISYYPSVYAQLAGIMKLRSKQRLVDDL